MLNKRPNENGDSGDGKKRKVSGAELNPTPPPPPAAASFLARPRIAALWREVGLSQADFFLTVDLGPRDEVRELVEVKFWKFYEKAEEMENRRVEGIKEKIRQGVQMKNPARRPTDVTLRLMREAGLERPGGKVMGHVPGVNIGDRFKCRAEMVLVGLHKQVMGGIDMVTLKTENDEKKFVTSIVAAGGYEDDLDDGDRLIYTGSGGNDTLGDKTQVKDQQLTSRNLAFFQNAKYCVPVRVIRTYKEKGYSVYDGLYDVEHMTKERGVKGYIVYKFHLTRCPGQEEAHGIKVEFGGGSKRVEKKEDCVVCWDITSGMEKIPIPAVNNVDDMLPPGISLEEVPEGTQSKEWKEDPEEFEYSPELVYDVGVKIPKSPRAPLGPAHDEVSRLNGLSKGILPYQNKTLGGVCPILYECGNFMGCRKRDACDQRITQSPISVKLRVFKTKDRGWAVQSLQRIPAFSFVCAYKGIVYKASSPNANDNYAYNLCRRTDYDDDGNYVEGGMHVDVEFVVTGLKCGNVFRYVNHSCDPNCFIQPTLGPHHDKSMPEIALFTLRDIHTLEELTYDYGTEFVEELLEGDCKCRTAVCISRDLVVEVKGEKKETKRKTRK